MDLDRAAEARADDRPDAWQLRRQAPLAALAGAHRRGGEAAPRSPERALDEEVELQRTRADGGHRRAIDRTHHAAYAHGTSPPGGPVTLAVTFPRNPAYS